MANPTKKTTSRQVSIKITAGSALERLTEGRSFTKTVHEVFEMYARAMGEGQADPGPAAAPQEEFRSAPEWDGSTDVDILVTDQGKVLASAPLPVVATMPGGKRYQVLDIDGVTVLDLSEEEMLKLAAEQYPSGLVPILDERMIASEEGEIDNEEVVEPEQDDFDYEALV
jgi:hypothetical protein